MSGILDAVAVPQGWQVEPFGRIVARRQEAGKPNLPPLSVFLDEGVVPRASREDNYNRLGADLSRYQVVAPGDIVFNRLRTWQGGLGASRYEGIVSPAYFVCRPRAGVDSGYLHHLLRSVPYLQALTRISKWMPPSQFDILWSDLRTLPMLIPPSTHQREITRFLDKETVRIERLIVQKRLMIELFQERIAAIRHRWAASLLHTWGAISLRRVIGRIEQGWSPQCENVEAAPHEWGILKTSAVSGPEFRPHENKRLPEAVQADFRWVVRDGDLLMTRGSGSLSMVGRVAVADTRGRQLMLSDLIYRLRLHDANPEFVSCILQAPSARQRIEAAVRTDVGQTLKIRVEDIKNLSLPALPLARQQSEVKTLNKALTPVGKTCALLTNQIVLLQEHRQALVTKIVTGQLPIPGAAA